MAHFLLYKMIWNIFVQSDFRFQAGTSSIWSGWMHKQRAFITPPFFVCVGPAELHMLKIYLVSGYLSSFTVCLILYCSFFINIIETFYWTYVFCLCLKLIWTMYGVHSRFHKNIWCLHLVSSPPNFHFFSIFLNISRPWPNLKYALSIV